MHPFTHEYGHVFQTFLGNGRVNTPPNASGAKASRDTHRIGSEGEAGAFLERALYGGIISFPRDQFPNGDIVFEREFVGFP